MNENIEPTRKRSRNDKYSKLQKKRRKFFYSQQQRDHQKPPFPRWPVNVDSIRLCKKKDDQQLTTEKTNDTSDTHADRVLDLSLEKLHDSLDTMTSAQYKTTLDDAVNNATNMIHDIMMELSKNERRPSQESSHLTYEDVLLAALGAHVPPLVIQRALDRMKTITPLEDHVTEQIIYQACNPSDIFGATGKSLVSMESIYGFFSPVEGEMTKSILPVESEFYKHEPNYMSSLRPSISTSGLGSGITVEHDFLNMTLDGTSPSE